MHDSNRRFSRSTWIEQVLDADTAKYVLPLCVLHSSLPCVPVVVAVVVALLVAVLVPVVLADVDGVVDVVAVLVPVVVVVSVVVTVVVVSVVVTVDVSVDVADVEVVTVGVVVCVDEVVSVVVPVEVPLEVADVVVVTVDVPVEVGLVVAVEVGVVWEHSVNVPSLYESIAAFSTPTAAVQELASLLVAKNPPSEQVNGLVTPPREYSATVAVNPSATKSSWHCASSTSNCCLSNVVHFTESAPSTHDDSTLFRCLACTAQLVAPVTAM